MEILLNNKNNHAFETLFDGLIQEVFGFSFAPWLEEKLWGESYESYSIIENGIMLSNVCIFKSQMIINGEKARANQFGAVATRKEARGCGLSRLLTEHILSLYPDTLAYLSANPSVIDFYPRFGFRQIQTYKPQITAQINNPAKAVKFQRDDPKFINRLKERTCFSKRADCTNSQSIQLFHAIMEYADDIYYLPNADVFAIAQQHGESLFLADIIAKAPVTFAQLCRELPFNGINTVEFGFCPDWLDVNPQWIPASMEDEPFFIKGDWNLPEHFRFPAMSET